jgi:hypothetical protein
MLTNKKGDYVELYDLIKDPLEKVNLKDKNLNTVTQLKKMLSDWRNTLPKKPTGKVFSKLRKKTTNHQN